MRPVLIVAPPYNRLDSHIKALHLLCHYLNEAGADAYLTTDIMNPRLHTKYTWQTPPRSVTLYPESISGHPYGTPKSARWFLGLRRVPGTGWEENETVFVISNRFREQAENLTNGQVEVLWVPTFDYNAFCPPPDDSDRKGYAVYMRDMSKLPDWYDPTGSCVIKKDNPFSQAQMVEIFQHKELFITDDVSTSMIDEARMCGCPVWVTNGAEGDHYERIEYGDDGVCFSEEGIALAIKTVGAFRKKYLGYTKSLGDMLRRFMVEVE